MGRSCCKKTPFYEKVIEQELPSVLDDILTKAKEGTTEEEQINIVTSLLNKEILYMGDWKSIKGMQYPRALQEVCNLKQADCKEFSSCTAAILRKMGYQAYVAHMLRGEKQLSFEKDLPNLYGTNHAILKVITPSQKTLWIDPTNFTSMADGIFPDIQGKKALVLHPETPSYETIPFIKQQHAGTFSTCTITLLENGELRYDGSILFKGEDAIPFTGVQLKLSKDTIQENLLKIVSGDDVKSITSSEVKIPDLTSRIVENKEFSFSYTSENTYKSNYGTGIILSSDTVTKIISSTKGQVTMLPLGHPSTNEREYVIKDIQPENTASLNCCYRSPWVDVIRECVYKGNDTCIKETVVTKTPFITREELESETYRALKEGIIRNFAKTCIIFPDASSKPTEGAMQEEDPLEAFPQRFCKARNTLQE